MILFLLHSAGGREYDAMFDQQKNRVTVEIKLQSEGIDRWGGNISSQKHQLNRSNNLPPNVNVEVSSNGLFST
jgi:hypothetical protein